MSLDLLTKHNTLPKPDRIAEIKQGYVAVSEGAATRIRYMTMNGKGKWILTFKQKIANRQIEVEQELDERDGQDLWSIARRRVEKTRYFFERQGLTWELDLFHNELDGIYFILAEVELPEGAARPQIMPDFLRNQVIYEVALTDERFSNKKLGDADYAVDLYLQIKKGVIDGNSNKKQED